jgi:uncharacterized membrane protein YedE/YeeE
MHGSLGPREAHVHPSLSALIGGALIGVATVGLLYTSGKRAGISGILGGALTADGAARSWRLRFLVGLVAAGFVMARIDSSLFSAPTTSWAILVVAGLLVGAGARLSGGCTSGHGICGLGAREVPSLIATVTFMLTGAIAVLAMRALVGEAS